MESIFSKQITNSLKGIFAVVILIHHLLTRSGVIIQNEVISLVITHLGYWGVSVFFFISGYGLMLNYISGGGYKDSFIKKRVLPMVALNFFLIAIYSLQRLIIHQDISANLIIQSVFIGKTVVKFGWYFQAIIIFYLLFYLSMCTKLEKKLLLNFSFVILYIVVCKIAGLKSYYFVTAISFPFGMLYAQYCSTINKVIDKWRYQCTLALMIVLLLLIWLQLNVFRNILLVATESCFFVAFVVVITSYVPIINKATKVLGDYSLAIYAVQGLAYGFVNCILTNIVNNPLLFMFSWTSLTFILAYIIKPFFNKIMNIREKLCQKLV